MKQFLETGKIVGTHGIRGEVRVQPWCDTPEFLAEFKTLYFDEGKNDVNVLSARVHKNVLLMKINGVDTIEEAERYRGKILYLSRADVKLETGSYFVEDLIGCFVSDADSGDALGVITDVTNSGANDVWYIQKDEKEYLVPAIPDVVVSVDIENGKAVIRPLKGIFDDAD